MNATLSIARASMLASDMLVPVAGGARTPDLWMQDNADDTGSEPDPSSHPMWISDDIWVRNAADGLTNQDHQNPWPARRTAVPRSIAIIVDRRFFSQGRATTIRLQLARVEQLLTITRNRFER